MTTPKPPGPAGTSECGNEDGPWLGSGIGSSRCRRPAGHYGNHVDDKEYTRHEWAQIPERFPPAPAAPVEAPFVEARDPVTFTVGEVVRVDYAPARDAEGWTPDGRVVKKALDRLWDAPSVEHPAPWRWERGERMGRGYWDLRDAAGAFVLRTAMDWGHPPIDHQPSPRVRALTEAAPELADTLAKVTADLRSFLESEYSSTADRDGSKAVARSPVLEAEDLLARIDAAGEAGK